MAPHKTRVFESMPQELLVIVLGHMSSPEDVLSTIRASPLILKAFIREREQVFASVLETALAPEVFRELLAIVNAPDHKNCPYVGHPDEMNDSNLDEWRSWELKVRSFLEEHAAGATHSISSPRTDVDKFRTQIKFMTRLYFCLIKFVDFYPAYVSSVASRKWPQDQAPDWPRLTDTEILRLQRGLLRHELCCRLIGIPSKVLNFNGDGDLSTEIMEENTFGLPDIWWDNPFGGLLPIDELEEINCASLYLKGLYHMQYSEVGKELQCDLGALATKYEGSAGTEDGSKTGKKTVENWLEQARAQHKILPQNLSHDWTDSLSSLGLVVLDLVSNSTPTDRRQLMLNTFATYGHLNNPSFDSVYDLDNRLRRSLTFGPHCNPAVRDIIQAMLDKNIEDLPGRNMHDLRAIGWAFFDDWLKIESSGLHAAETSSVQHWLTKHRSFRTPRQPPIPTSTLTTYISEHDWHAQIVTKYSCENYSEDYRAMARFVLGVRLVVDFNSAQLPNFS
ncbi:hypothetical protein FJTKL_15376 [Diaporthe vaccinii]|uniref:F-box domain-containing protein n=1 Tax=Diaporthe vaccinii TaxID=105482 RepID=A0ABR4E536_9PEZI